MAMAIFCNRTVYSLLLATLGRYSVNQCDCLRFVACINESVCVCVSRLWSPKMRKVDGFLLVSPEARRFLGVP